MADPEAGTLAETDLGQQDKKWSCTKVTELEAVARAGYWLWKSYKWLAEF